MRKQYNKRKKLISALIVFGIGVSAIPAAKSSSRTYTAQKKNEVNDRLRLEKPVAGRNRRRSKSAVSLSKYPRANEDNVRVSKHISKLRINVLSNDDGYKLRVTDINSRSASGARVSMKNGMAIYQAPDHFEGKDSFWYTMEDKSGRQHSARVIVCICDK